MVEAVGAPIDPAGTVAVVLVAQGVGEGLDRMVVGDDVAVAVEPAVDLDEPQGAVPGEDLEAGVAEDGTDDRHRPLGRRREARVAVVRRAAAPWPGDPGVQEVPVQGEVGEQIEALLGGGLHRPVDHPQPAEHVLPLDVEAEAVAGGQPGDAPQPEGRRVAQVRWPEADHLRRPVRPVGAGAVGVVGAGVGGRHVVLREDEAVGIRRPQGRHPAPHRAPCGDHARGVRQRSDRPGPRRRPAPRPTRPALPSTSTIVRRPSGVESPANRRPTLRGQVVQVGLAGAAGVTPAGSTPQQPRTREGPGRCGRGPLRCSGEAGGRDQPPASNSSPVALPMLPSVP
jgi:hypothetical protein